MIRQHYLRQSPEGDPAAGGGAPPAGGSPPPPWYEAIPDAGMKSYYQAKGFKDPVALAEGYYNLEKTIGVPRERLLHLPENLEEAEPMGKVYDRLGRPAKADDYNIKVAEGEDDTFVKWAKKEFHELGFSGRQGEKLVNKWGEFAKAQDEAFAAKQRDAFTAEAGNLKKEWGAAHDQNTSIAKAAAAKLGVNAEAIKTLESVVGFSAVMKMFHEIGTKIGEPNFVGNTDGGNSFAGNVNTPAAAIAKIEVLKADKAWFQRFTSGDAAAKAEWNKLHLEAYPSPTN